MFANPGQLAVFIFAAVFCLNTNANTLMAIETSVNEMLVIDAQRAMLTEQKMLSEVQERLGGGSIQSGVGLQNNVTTETVPTESIITPVRMEVLGIFGIGENLLADVAIDSNRVRFKRGQKFPLGASHDYPYQLLSIQVPCVKIADSYKTVHNICLSKSGL